MQRFFNRKVSVASNTIDVGDGMANGACDPRVRRGMIDIIIIRIVELPAEERDWIVAASAEASSPDIPVSLLRNFASFSHAHQVRWIVEGAVLVRALFPTGVHVGVAFFAVLVVLERLFGNKLAIGRACQRWLKVLRTFG